MKGEFGETHSSDLMQFTRDLVAEGIEVCGQLISDSLPTEDYHFALTVIVEIVVERVFTDDVRNYQYRRELLGMKTTHIS